MDNYKTVQRTEQPVPNQNQANNFLNRKVILVVLGVIVLAEILWAVWTLSKPSQRTTQPASTSLRSSPTIISLKADKNTVKVGEKVTVTIDLSSQNKTDGTDLVIIYDPKLLSVVTASADNTPVNPGTIYNSYPQNKLDTQAGRITVSGITDKTGGVLASGVFGSVVFKGQAAGKAKVSLEFTPGSTTDSNIIESGTGKDVLEKVNNLEVNINP